MSKSNHLNKSTKQAHWRQGRSLLSKPLDTEHRFIDDELLGPKDRKLVAGPALRGGRGDVTVSYLSTEGAPQFVPALRAFRAIRRSSPSSRTGLLTSGPSDLKRACG